MLPTWDLLIIISFVLVIAYSFIVGKDQTMKIIIGSYIALLTADGVGNLLREYVINPDSPIKQVAPYGGSQTIIILKIAIFLTIIVYLTLKPNFSVSMGGGGRTSNFLMTLVFALLSAGLIVSTVIVYTSGSSFVFQQFVPSKEFVNSIYAGSVLVRMMVDYASIWFALPALAFLFAGAAE